MPHPLETPACDNAPMPENTPKPWIKRIAVALLLLTLGIVAGAMVSRSSTPTVDNGAAAQIIEPRPLQPFRLSVDGVSLLDNDNLRGKWSLLFFGYTHCPDICPATLAELARAYELLAQEPGVLDDTQFIFVSVDPARDTPQTLAAYTDYFNPAFIGVTGDTEQLTALARQMGIQFRRGAGSDEAYNVEHASAILLIDPQVRYHARINAPHHAQDVRRQFLEIRRQYKAPTS